MDTTTTADSDDLPGCPDLDAMHRLMGHGDRTPEGIDVRGAQTRLLVYWDRQDVNNQGWAWALHHGRRDDGSYGCEDVTSGPLDDACELESLLTIVEGFARGTRVEGGEPGTEDHDTGRVVSVKGDMVTVAWDSGVTTTQRRDALRREEE